MRVVLALALAALALAVPAGAVSSSGVRGLVLRGPTKPVCEEGATCTAPAVHLALVFSRSGRVVARAVTDRSGRFSLALAPGSYVVRTARPAGFAGKGLQPRSVSVPGARWIAVRFALDTGIR